MTRYVLQRISGPIILGPEPRVTSTEEPDGGNLLVRIWRGAGVGNLPAYSTTAFWRRPAGVPPQHPRWRLAAPPACRGSPPEWLAARRCTAPRTLGWCWTGVSG